MATTNDIYTNIISQLESSLGQTIPVLPRAFLRVLAKVLAGVWVILYKYCGFIFQQLFVSTATNSVTEINGVKLKPLTEWGRLVGVGDSYPGTAAVNTVQITVINQIGTIPSGTQVINTATGYIYALQTTLALDAPTKTVNIIAVSDQAGGAGLGSAGNLAVGQILSFVNPVVDVDPEVTVTAVVTTAVDPETDTAYRQRIINFFQRKPQGGAKADYYRWGMAVADVKSIYPYTSDTPGEVDVYVESAVATDGIAPAGMLSDVSDAIELDRPVGALVNVVSITRTEYTVQVSGLPAVPPTGMQTAITSAVQQYFLAREPFIEGLSVPPRKDRITPADVIAVISGVVAQYNSSFGTAVIKLLPDPTELTFISLGNGQKVKAAVSYV